jgi:hypothetical protein
VDIESVDGQEILSTVYKEIRGKEREIILDNTLTYKIESLLEKSSFTRRLMFFNSLDLHNLVKKSLGSRVVEKLLFLIFNDIYVHRRADTARARALVDALDSFMEKGFMEYVIDRNGTFVVRLYFQLLSGRRIEEKKVIKFKSVKECREQLGKYESILLEHFHEILREKSSMITLLAYLKCKSKRQKVISKILGSWVNAEALGDPVVSYFYEGVVSLSKGSNLSKFYEMVRKDFIPLCLDRNGNFIMQELIKRYDVNVVYDLLYEHLNKFPFNSNVILSMVLALQNNNCYDRAVGIIKEFYLHETNGDVYDVLLFRNSDSIDTKYLKIVVNLYLLPREHDLSREVNDGFNKHFSKMWLYERSGSELVKTYLMGKGDAHLKSKFITNISNEFRKMSTNVYGIEILKMMRNYSQGDAQKRINYILKSLL